MQALNAKRQPPLQFEALAVPPTAAQLKAAADAIFLKAKALFPISTAWPNLDSEQVMPRLQKLYQTPYLFQQGNLGLCPAATFFYHMYTLKPVETAQFAQDLYLHANGTLGKLVVRPGSDLLKADYHATIFIHKALRFFPDQADWMIMCSLRDSENAWFDYEGNPSDFVGEWSSAGHLSDWYTTTGFFTSVKFDSYYLTDPSVDTLLQTLVKTDKNGIALRIKTKMLRSLGVQSSILPDFHIIPVLTTPVIDKAMNRIEFQYWTWGRPPPLVLNEDLDFVRDCIMAIIVVTF